MVSLSEYVVVCVPVPCVVVRVPVPCVVVCVPVPCVALAVVVRPISAPSAASRRRPPPPVALLMSLPLGGRRTNSKHGPHTY